MNLSTFKQSLKKDHPSEELSDALSALWWDKKGNWDKAHKTAQDVGNTEGSWVHAYLHRKEGDQANAAYWYSRAGRQKSPASLDQEWEDIVEALLQKS